MTRAHDGLLVLLCIWMRAGMEGGVIGLLVEIGMRKHRRRISSPWEDQRDRDLSVLVILSQSPGSPGIRKKSRTLNRTTKLSPVFFRLPTSSSVRCRHRPSYADAAFFAICSERITAS